MDFSVSGILGFNLVVQLLLKASTHYNFLKEKYPNDPYFEGIFSQVVFSFKFYTVGYIFFPFVEEHSNLSEGAKQLYQKLLRRNTFYKWSLLLFFLAFAVGTYSIISSAS